MENDKNDHTKQSSGSDDKEFVKPRGNKFDDHLSYPAGEDIYNQSEEEADLDPEDPSQKKIPNEKYGRRNEKSFSEDVSGSDLDIPGSDLDDDMEANGNEDEENNGYSLGGDEHNDLDEDKGD